MVKCNVDKLHLGQFMMSLYVLKHDIPAKPILCALSSSNEEAIVTIEQGDSLLSINQQIIGILQQLLEDISHV